MSLTSFTSPPPARRGSSGLDSLWYVAGAPQVLIVLAVLLAVTVAFAAVFPQLPAGLDAPAADRWFTATAASYGNAGPFLRGIGAFNILNTPWTIALLAALAFHLILRLAGQLAHLLGRRSYANAGEIPPVPAGLPFAASRQASSSSEAIRDTASALGKWTQSRRKAGEMVSPGDSAVEPEQLPEPAQPPPTTLRQAQLEERQAVLFAERRSWAAPGPLLGYLGPLIIILGLLWNGITGWRAEGVALAVGETASPSQAQGLSVTLSAAGQGVAQLTLNRGNLSHALFVSGGRPGRWGSLWLAERATGPVLTVEARDLSGARAPVEVLDNPRGAAAAPNAPVSLRFREGESEQAFAINAQGLVFQAVSYPALPERGINRPVFFIEGYQGDSPAPGLSELVEDGAEVEWEGLTFTFKRDRYVVVDLAALPGLPLILAGGALTLLGALLSLWLGNIRAWAHVTTTPEGAVVAVRSSGPVLPQDTADLLLGPLAPAPLQVPEQPVWTEEQVTETAEPEGEELSSDA